jgi:transcription elongation factor GreB
MRSETDEAAKSAGCSASKMSTGFCSPGNVRAVTEVVAWAAGNGDHSENADYQYGKRRLRQIDGRIRFLTKRIEAAEVADPEAPRAGQAATRAFFGATVRYEKSRTITRFRSLSLFG